MGAQLSTSSPLHHQSFPVHISLLDGMVVGCEGETTLVPLATKPPGQSQRDRTSEPWDLMDSIHVSLPSPDGIPDSVQKKKKRTRCAAAAHSTTWSDAPVRHQQDKKKVRGYILLYSFICSENGGLSLARGA